MSKGLKSIMAVLAFALLVCASALPGAAESGHILQSSGPASGISKSILVVGFKKRWTDLAWNHKAFEQGVRVIKRHLKDLGLTVLDEAAIPAYKGVEDRLKTGIYRRPALMHLGKAAKADWLLILCMAKETRKVSASNPLSFAVLDLNLEIMDLNLARVLAVEQAESKVVVAARNPRDSDWNQALGQAARQAAARAMQGAGPKIAANLKPGGPLAYEMRFERFRDEHLDAILADLDALSLIDSIDLTRQSPSFAHLRVMSPAPAIKLLNQVKRILRSHGYRSFRLTVEGNSFKFENSTKL